ncbi:MAG: hypothetical protein K6F39_03575, partial [Lachnospiraceae bacterium]|nr:hypothetical protein [Lachnospiraceae bacterium]
MGFSMGKGIGTVVLGAVLACGVIISVVKIGWNESAEVLPVSSNRLNSKIISLSLFTDVENWAAPEWSLDDGTVTGIISKDTGVKINSQVPAQDA